MREAGLSIERLAEKTREVDPLGYGISRATVGHMVSRGPSGRTPFRDRSCDLVARALDKSIEELFDTSAPA
jgi:hypothetical protein